MMIARAALSASACAARSAASALIARVIAASISSESTTASRSLSRPATTSVRSAILSLSRSIRDARDARASVFVSIPDRSRLFSVFSTAVKSLSRLMIVVLCWFCCPCSAMMTGELSTALSMSRSARPVATPALIRLVISSREAPLPS